MKEITALTLEKMEQEFDANAAHKLAMNAATKIPNAMYIAGAASTIAVSFVTSPIKAPRIM